MPMRFSRSLAKQPPESMARCRRILGHFCSSILLLLATAGAATASGHYTTKQLDALAARVGKTFWFGSDVLVPEFLDAPAANAGRFRPSPEDSFVIIDLAGRAQKNPYYAVRFASGKVGYIRPESFHEALNLTILTADPRAAEREQQEKQNREEKERVAWIRSQPWSGPVKEAAIRRQPTPGLTTGEVKRVLGTPMRVTELRTPTKVEEEHWFYKDGSVLIFHNRLLTKIENVKK
jgi:hypothetical protein